MAVGITNLSQGVGTPFMVEVVWEQPVISDYGVEGVNELWVKPSSLEVGTNYSWKIFDNVIGDANMWVDNATYPKNLEFGFNKPINIEKIEITNRSSWTGQALKEFDIYVKYIFNEEYVFLKSFLNTNNNTAGEYWELPMDVKNVTSVKFVINSSYTDAGYNNVIISEMKITATTLGSNYTPYTVQSLQSIGVEPASNYEERKEQLATMGVQ